MAKARTTLTLDEALLRSLQKCAEIQGVSLSSLVNDWLVDTLPSIDYYSHQIAGERDHVRRKVAEVNAALQVVQEGYAQVRKFSGKAGSRGRSGAPHAADEPVPPSCNTGGKFANGRGGRRG